MLAGHMPQWHHRGHRRWCSSAPFNFALLQGAAGVPPAEVAAAAYIADLRVSVTPQPQLLNRTHAANPATTPSMSAPPPSTTARQLRDSPAAAGSEATAGVSPPGPEARGLVIRRAIGQLPAGAVRLQVITELQDGSQIMRVSEVAVAAAFAATPPPPPSPVQQPAQGGAGWFADGLQGAGSARTVVVVYVAPLLVVLVLAAWLLWRWRRARRSRRIVDAAAVAEDADLPDESLQMVVAEGSYVRSHLPSPSCHASAHRGADQLAKVRQKAHPSLGTLWGPAHCSAVQKHCSETGAKSRLRVEK